VPAEQRREVLTWDLATGGHLGIAGGSRSGRSTTLAAVAVRLAESNRPDDVHLHVLQGVPGPCAALSALPHAGTVTSAMDPTVVRRLLTRLVGMVAGTDSVTGADPRARHTVVIVDGWESVEEALSTIDHGAPLDDLHRLLRDGPVVGMRFAVAGGRAVISGRLPGLLQQRLVLHLPDPLDLTLAGIDPAFGAAARPPGRAIDVRSGREVQLAVAGEDGSPTATAAAIAIAIQRQSLVADSGREGPIGPAPWRLSPLPADIDLGALPADPDGVVVGVGGDSARPLVIALGPGRQRLLVAGPSRSGRSNAMSALASRLLEQGRRILVVAPRRGGLGVWARAHGCEVLTPRDQPDTVLDRAHDPDVCVLVDDLELVEGSPVEPALLEVARIIDGTGGVIVVAAQLSRANAAFRGLVPEVARDGCGILLGPTSPTDGDVLGVRLDLPLERRPGRGFLVVHGLTEPFQVARVDDGDGVRPSLASRGLVYPPRAS
jgi:S-DNA-T family DNA segregation ATPase FtsK/SpoIIIE